MSTPITEYGPTLEGDDFMTHLYKIASETSSVDDDLWVLVGDTVILGLTIAGSLFIIGMIEWNEFKGKSATTRMRLVQSLVLSDLIMGIVGLIGCGLVLNGKPLKVDTPECDGLGVTMVAVIFSQHLWTLSLAASTFMILVHPLHSITSWIEKYWYWSWLAVWVISFAVSILGYLLYGYGPTGGICYYMNDAGLFAELIQFIPRAIVFLVIAVLYGKLYVFLKRPDKIRTGYTDSAGNTSSFSRIKSSWFGRSSRKSHRKSREAGGGGLFGRGGNRTVVLDADGHRLGKQSAGSSDSSGGSKTEGPTTTTTRVVEAPPLAAQRTEKMMLPRLAKRPPPLPSAEPWEQVELPPFQVDGQRYGGSEVERSPHREGMWRDWGGFNKKRASATSLQSSQATRVVGVDQSPLPSPFKGSFDKAMVSPTGTLFENKVSPTRSTFEPKVSPTLYFPASPSGSSPPREGHNEILNTPNPNDSPGIDRPQMDFPPDLTRPLQAVSATQSTGRTQVIGLYQGFNAERRGSLPDGTIPFRRASGIAMPPAMLSPAAVGGGSQSMLSSASRGWIAGNIADLPRAETPASSNRRMTPRDLEKGLVEENEDKDDDDDDDDGRWDLMRMLQEAPPTASRDPFVVQQTQASENVEYVAESMASYLNRKASLLMLWFPLGYVLLFSVSTIRIIYDFVGTPPPELRALSRWTMFGQGILDGIIYGVIEFHTKRVVRRRVRKGTFSPRNSRTSQGRTGGGEGTGTGGLGSAIRQGISGMSNPSATAKGVCSGGQTRSRRDGASPTVSFADPETSILQRVMEEPWIEVDTTESGSSGTSGTSETRGGTEK